MKSKLLILLVAVILLAACTTTSPAETAADSSPTPASVSVPETITAQVEIPAFNAADPYGLAYVREEEKLARDVYLFLYEQWGLAVFSNIASSEQTHTSTIQGLLGTYGLVDPAADTLPGQFSDPSLQALFDQLTARGSHSLSEAIKVGAAVEEIDILDLQARLESDLPDDVRLAYGSLLSGSYNHLAAFTSTLQRQSGEVYTPQYMTLEAYQAALAQASTGGRGGSGYRGGQP